MESSAFGARSGWEEAGQDVANQIEPYSAVVVTAEDPVVAAEVALGIAKAEASRRRVAVGDMAGDLAPLNAMFDSRQTELHGIADCFLYGVSVSKIGVPASNDPTGNIFILPSGTEPVQDPQIYRSDRWQRLAKGFKETGALLLLVAPAATQGVVGLDELIDQMEGVVLVGSSRLNHFTYLNVVARIPHPRLHGNRAMKTASQQTPKTGYSRTILITVGVSALVMLGGWLGWLGWSLLRAQGVLQMP